MDVQGGGGRDRIRTGEANDPDLSGSASDSIDAGSGDDTVNALDGRRDRVVCGDGRDTAFVDPSDIVSGCESQQPRRLPPAGADECGRTRPMPASGLTVAVTGPTGDLGIGVVGALQRSRAVKRIVGMARRPFDPAEHGWKKAEYRQGDVTDPQASASSSRAPTWSCIWPSRS